MGNLTVDNQELVEENSKDFSFVLNFSGVLSLSKSYISKTNIANKNNDEISKILEEADFHLIPEYYYDFGQDNPHVVVQILVDDEQYIDLVDHKDRSETEIDHVFDSIDPGNISRKVLIYPKSLRVLDSPQWRTAPHYQIGEQEGIVDQEAIEGIWGAASALHIFITHKAAIKERAHKLKELLGEFGVIGFVAHDDIEPTQEWRGTIEKALFSSDALIALLTRDFSDSDWTDQEVGIAFGRQLPVFPVKMDATADPYGFIGKIQAFTLRDDVIEKFVEKFLADDRTTSPTINSLLQTLRNLSETKKVEIICGLLSKTNAVLWRTRQKENFKEIYESNGVMRQCSLANQILQRIAPPRTSAPSTMELDDEIPF